MGKDKQLTFVLSVLIVLGCLAGMYYVQTEGINIKRLPFYKYLQQPQPPTYPNRLVIQSSAFQNNEKIPIKYTCDGENVNPPLEFTNIPPETKSLVLVVTDIDTPLKEFTHWFVYNISPATKSVPENSIPESGTEGPNSLGKGNYEGPCPPSGSHRYQFSLYALGKELPDNKVYTKEKLLSQVQNNILDKAILTGYYK